LALARQSKGEEKNDGLPNASGYQLYSCQNYQCQLPVSDLEEAKALLDSLYPQILI